MSKTEREPLATYTPHDGKVWDETYLEIARELGPQYGRYETLELKHEDNWTDVTFVDSEGLLPDKTFRFADFEITPHSFAGNWLHFTDHLPELGDYPWPLPCGAPI